ncbi:MAG: DUF4386 family protein [Solirubrobacteraceae bacterium]
MTLRQDLAGAAATDNASLILNGRSRMAVHDATFLLGPAFCAAIGNGLMLGYLMFRSGLVPRGFALFGIGIGAGSLALVTAILVLFGAYDLERLRSRRTGRHIPALLSERASRRCRGSTCNARIPRGWHR